MRKILCLLLCLLLPLGAFAEPRMPEWRGNINDSADILTAQTLADLSEFSKQLSQQAGVDLHVATVHFLDGLDAQAYAARLFEKWELDDTDLLLLGVAGEDSFAAVMGSGAERTLGRTNTENLLYLSSDFGSLFRSQRYDDAMAAFAVGLNTLTEKQTGGAVRLDGLFGREPAVTIAPFELNGGELWQQVMESINETPAEEWFFEDEEDGMSAGSWIALLVLISILLRERKRDRQRRRMRGAGRSGCGCSPLGWIVGLLGLGFLFGKE